MPNQSVIVLDFGGQYNQLIARRVRECNVYCEVKPNTMTVDEIRAFDPIGIIFTGGPQSVYAEGSPQVDPEIFRLGIPIHVMLCSGKPRKRRQSVSNQVCVLPYSRAVSFPAAVTSPPRYCAMSWQP